MAGKLSPPPLPFFFQGSIWKIVVNLQSEIFIPKWAVIISDHAGSLALQWITGWNNTIWADSTWNKLDAKKGEQKWNNKNGEML